MDVRRKNLLGGVSNTPLQRVYARMAERDEDAGGGSSVYNIFYSLSLTHTLTHTQVIAHDHMSPNQVITGTFQDVRRKNLLGQKVPPSLSLAHTHAHTHTQTLSLFLTHTHTHIGQVSASAESRQHQTRGAQKEDRRLGKPGNISVLISWLLQLVCTRVV